MSIRNTCRAGSTYATTTTTSTPIPSTTMRQRNLAAATYAAATYATINLCNQHMNSNLCKQPTYTTATANDLCNINLYNSNLCKWEDDDITGTRAKFECENEGKQCQTNHLMDLYRVHNNQMAPLNLRGKGIQSNFVVPTYANNIRKQPTQTTYATRQCNQHMQPTYANGKTTT